MSGAKTAVSSPKPAPNRFCLRAINGASAGLTWSLSEGVTLIGRGIGCHVRLEEPHISRVQCELTLANGALTMRSMGVRNPTCVNQVARELAVLSSGDIISIADAALIVEVVPADEIERKKDEGSLTTQIFANVRHLRTEFDATEYSARFAEELHSLVGVLRSLGRAESLDELVAQLIAHVQNRLGAQRVWLAWRSDSHADLVLFPPASPGETQAAPLHVMREACVSGVGMSVETTDSPILASPLLHGRDTFGAIAVGRDRAWTESELQYLVAVAECCAPLVRAAERLQQLQRDASAVVPAELSMSMQGESAAMRELNAEIRRAAVARINVILLGETGVGKELAARTLHDLSARNSGPYVAVNCAAISPELFESEMFGHERGAFTGASRRKKGLFELAHCGSLFLDEISELSITNQARVLRAVELGVLRPVGAEKELKVDVRIICATNRELLNNDQANFRADLYHRLAGIVVRLKPLREHKEDITRLANHFLIQSAPHSPSHPKEFTQEAIEKLMAYDWPGNIRELRNVVERACYMSRASVIVADDIRIDSGAPRAVSSGEIVSLDELERRHLLEMLRRYKNNALDVAHALGISRSALYYKFSRYGIKPRDLSE